MLTLLRMYLTDLALVYVIIISLLTASKADNCESLDGKWYNQLGSEIILTHTRDGQIEGEYRTAVERMQGAAGSSHSKVIGAAPYDKPGAAFGFAVMWGNGASTTAWTGQCLMCDDGKETLVTSWLLRSKVDTCLDKWKSTRIGRDFFTREEQAMGPRKDQGTHSPGNGYDTNGDESRGVDYRQMEKRDTDNKSQRSCSLDGFWYNAMGSEMILEHRPDNTVHGEYRTAVEREHGAAGSSHSKVYGIGNPQDANSTWAMFVVWKGGESVTAWVGQCHVCEGSRTEVLESAWLLRAQVPHCSDSWRSTLYGENSYTHHQQTQHGPRKKENTHTPGEGGEDDSLLVQEAKCSSMAAFAIATTNVVWFLVVCVLTIVHLRL